MPQPEKNKISGSCENQTQEFVNNYFTWSLKNNGEKITLSVVIFLHLKSCKISAIHCYILLAPSFFEKEINESTLYILKTFRYCFYPHDHLMLTF
jgi:hypothetical protein